MLLCHYNSPLGGITLASDGEALTGLWFDGQRHFGNTLHAPATATGAAPGDVRSPGEDGSRLPAFADAVRWLDCYFSGRDPGFTPPLHLHGTPFRKAVWRILLDIPYGQTVTYGEIAARLAAPAAKNRLAEGLGGGSVIARAVGGAVGSNPVSLIVPCHRVIGADGRLTGYAGGLDRKLRLLRLEGLPF